MPRAKVRFKTGAAFSICWPHPFPNAVMLLRLLRDLCEPTSAPGAPLLDGLDLAWFSHVWQRCAPV